MKLTLYPFQKEGVRKLRDVPHVLNGDEMGLGKTVQGIALDFEKRNLYKSVTSKTPGPTLVIAPLSVIPAWESHILRYWPTAKINVIDPKNRTKFVDNLVATFEKRARYQYHIVHWEALRLVPELRQWQWFHVIADEVHRAKNRRAQQTVALKKIPTMNKQGLSGTAADNMPQDLWSILNWLYPRKFTSYHRFFAHHVESQSHTAGGNDYVPCAVPLCDQVHRNAYKVVTGVRDAPELHRVMAPFYVRRLKSDPNINIQLPPKTYSELYVDLSAKQRRAYEQMRKEMIAWVGQNEEQPLAAPMVISQLIRLQQFAGAYGEIVRTMRNGEPVRQLKLTEPSTKIDAVMELVTDNENEKFVVFSQSKQIINLLVARLAAADISHVSLTGDTPQKSRGDVVEEFQLGNIRVFAGTIGAGGVGITLTAASTVVFLDRAWSPSVNAQAEDRCHRIGQQRNVQIIDVIARNTVDLGRLQKLEMKWEWVKEILGDDVTQLQRRFTEERALQPHSAQYVKDLLGKAS